MVGRTSWARATTSEIMVAGYATNSFRAAGGGISTPASTWSLSCSVSFEVAAQMSAASGRGKLVEILISFTASWDG